MQYLIALILACITIYLGSPVVGLLLGIGFSIVFLTDNEFITRKYATRLLQTGIILLGFSIDFSVAQETSSSYLLPISLFVVFVFLLTLILGKLLKLKQSYIYLIASGSSICGEIGRAHV